MAKDGLFFRSLARVDPLRSTPAVSLLVQGLWSSVLVFSGRYDQIFTYVIFVEFLFYAMAAGAVIVLRLREPGAPRPYRTPAYPWTPLAFIAASAALVMVTIRSSPREAAIGAALTLAGLPAFFYWRRRGGGAGPVAEAGSVRGR
jgi:APA family basic amino acid/polyamine antiporter